MRLPLFLGVLIACFISACSPAPTAKPAPLPPLANITGSDIRALNKVGDWALESQTGKEVHLSDFRGKVVALIFGYTHCPDICPTNLLTFADALNMLGDEAKKVQVAFITVDPKRDTREVLGSYVGYFNDRFLGLRPKDGNTQALEKVKQMYGVVSEEVHRKGDGGDYLVDHSAGNYLVDPTGRAAIYSPHGATAEEVANDIRVLLHVNPQAAAK